MAVPDTEEARRILAARGLPAGIVAHSEGVARVATEAARLVAASGIPVDVERVTVAALLHDIDKPLIQRDGMRHGELGAHMLEQMGFGELAPPVDSHTIEAIRDERRYPRGWVSVIIWVADKHVAQSFLTLDERLDDMIIRYPAYREDIQAARPHAHALEREVAEVSGLGVEQLVERLRDAWAAGAPDEAVPSANAAAVERRGRQEDEP